jgi:hypothetical protein
MANAEESTENSFAPSASILTPQLVRQWITNRKTTAMPRLQSTVAVEMRRGAYFIGGGVAG